MSPALADGLSNTELPREPCNYLSCEFLLGLVSELGKPRMKLIYIRLLPPVLFLFSERKIVIFIFFFINVFCDSIKFLYNPFHMYIYIYIYIYIHKFIL